MIPIGDFSFSGTGDLDDDSCGCLIVTQHDVRGCKSYDQVRQGRDGTDLLLLADDIGWVTRWIEGGLGISFWIELYAISQKFSRASYNIPILHSAGFQSGTKYWKTSREPH